MIDYSSYPHPVLGNRDDVASTAEIIEGDYEQDNDIASVNLSIASDDEQLRRMLDDGTVSFVIGWDSPATMARGMAEANFVPKRYGWDCRFSLLQEEIRGIVSVEVYLVANNNIENFRWEKQNPQYGNEEFRISKGDILGELSGGECATSTGRLLWLIVGLREM